MWKFVKFLRTEIKIVPTFNLKLSKLKQFIQQTKQSFDNSFKLSCLLCAEVVGCNPNLISRWHVDKKKMNEMISTNLLQIDYCFWWLIDESQNESSKISWKRLRICSAKHKFVIVIFNSPVTNCCRQLINWKLKISENSPKCRMKNILRKLTFCCCCDIQHYSQESLIIAWLTVDVSNTKMECEKWKQEFSHRRRQCEMPKRSIHFRWSKLM